MGGEREKKKKQGSDFPSGGARGKAYGAPKHLGGPWRWWEGRGAGWEGELSL